MFSFSNLLRVKQSLVTSTRSLKSSLPIKWIRPEKISCLDPRKSGDLEGLPDINLQTETPLEFRGSEELKTADPTVKRLFSLEFYPYKKTVELMRHKYVDLVKRHEIDYNSQEARVARMTLDIRDMQLYVSKFPTNKRTKVRLKETIDKRKRLIKIIRKEDYKRYEWLIEKLNVFFKPQPPYEVYKRVERKRSLRMLTDQYCKNLISQRMESYKTDLFAQQKQFLQEKINILETLLKTQQDYQVEKKTVTEDDVLKAKEQLRQWIEKNESDSPITSSP